MRRASFLILTLCVALVVTSCSSFAVAAATVNGQKVSETEVESELNTLRDDPIFGEALKRDPDTRGQRRRDILRELIYQAVAEQQAKRLHVTTTKAQAIKVINDAAKARGMTVKKFLASQNLTQAAAERLAIRIARRFALIDKVVKDVHVSESSVRDVYDGQKERYEEVHVARITVTSEGDALAAKREISTGKSFAAVAKDRSKDDLASDGGDMGSVALTSLDVQVQNALAAVDEGQVSDPIQTANGIEIYELISRTTQSFDDVEASIRNSLEQDQRDSSYDAWLADRVRSSKVVVNPKYGKFDRTGPQPTIVASTGELAP